MKCFTNNEIQRNHMCDVSKTNNLLGYIHDFEDYNMAHLGHAEDSLCYTAIEKPDL